MKNCIVLNGCSKDYLQQAYVLGEFVNNPDYAVIIYIKEEEKDFYISNCPAKNVLLLKIERYNNEDVVNILAKILNKDLIIFPPNIFGKEMCVRLGHRLKGTSLTNVESMEGDSFTKKVYSGYMTCEFKLSKKPFLISLSKSIKPLNQIPNTERTVEEKDMRETCSSSYIIKETIEEVDSGGLEKEKIIVTIGNGAKNKNDIEEVEEFSKNINGATGISRPVAMSGFAPMKKLIGASGTITNPELCIALGVSGSPAFYAGIEKSDFIIAVNTDEKAPIFKLCDVGIVGDYKEFIKEIYEVIKVIK
ncbi:electron transfer flavoprotein subunit alpha/FixB family protein [uncultured Ilyobacter sp.]|uniref:electron transfer flavoprotein subunit alpha/FixB family protein n=1 Tax=uncultured Ilyobacter sp. TaxID=544433 RepID=UPI0029F55C98|nr:electron transfer flavoprotein subunit alpha/FixB family protein [uncultured Ilyobacter sp.]